MECVEAAALKASFRAEMLAFRSWAQDQPSNDDNDEWRGSGVLTPGGDEFFVDGLLDFSNKDVVGGFLQEEDEDEEEEEKDCSIPGSTPRDDSYSGVLRNDDLEAGIDVPTDDLAALEWLSHFVEDSFTEFPSPNDSLPNNTAAATTNSSPSPSPSREQANHDPTAAPFAVGIQIPAKARSKRSRPGARVWSFCTPQSTESSTSSSSSLSSSSTSFASENLDFSSSSLGKPPLKKKKKPAVPVKDQTQRRCSHCLVEKTPQWRTGPLGSKTLCNACGVRYKSGRLLPEYRPAGSPTFLSHVHSNHHRKVLEMRRTRTEDGPGLAAAVESF